MRNASRVTCELFQVLNLFSRLLKGSQHTSGYSAEIGLPPQALRWEKDYHWTRQVGRRQGSRTEVARICEAVARLPRMDRSGRSYSSHIPCSFRLSQTRTTGQRTRERHQWRVW